MNNRIKKAYRNIFWGLVNKFFIVFLPFVNRTVLVHILGRNYLGLDGLFTSILQMLNITELGFSSAIIFSMYKPIADNDSEKICALLTLYKKVYRIIGSIILVLGLMIVPVLPSLIKADLPNNVNLYFLYFIFLLNTVLGYWLFAYKKSLISALQREDILSNVNTGIVLFQTILQIILVCIYKKYYFYILVMPCVTIVENLIIAALSKKMFPQYVPRGPIDEEATRDLKYRISGLVIQKLCATSRNSLDNIVLSAYIGLSTVSIYSNYYYIMHAINVILLCFTKAISAIVGNKIVKDTIENNHKDMIKFNFIYMWIASICTVCLVCLYQPFMKMWMGEDMLFPTYIMVTMCIYFYSLCIGDVRNLYTTGAGLWWEGRFRSFLEALSNLVLNIFLGKYFGVIGVIIATLFSIIIINFGYGATITYKYYFKTIKMTTYYMHNIYYAFVTFVAGLLSYVMCQNIPFGGIVELLTRFGTCVILTNIVLVIFYSRLKVFHEAKIFLIDSVKSIIR